VKLVSDAELLKLIKSRGVEDDFVAKTVLEIAKRRAKA
jgi:hypothetical protein